MLGLLFFNLVALFVRRRFVPIAIGTASRQKKETDFGLFFYFYPMRINKHDIYFWLAVLFAVWFALTAWVWTYLANVFIALPAGIISVVLWFKGGSTDPNTQRYQRIPIIWGVGILFSLVVLFILIATN
jgi:hypothetical protein